MDSKKAHTMPPAPHFDAHRWAGGESLAAFPLFEQQRPGFVTRQGQAAARVAFGEP